MSGVVIEQKDSYQKICDKVKSLESFEAHELKVQLERLSRLPETYKLDFVETQLKVLLPKCQERRDEILYEHYRNYVSIPCLSGLIQTLLQCELEFSEHIVYLCEHIRNLQLLPGPDARDKKHLESLQFNLIQLLEKLVDKEQEIFYVDLSTDDQVRDLALKYYDRILSSFISENDEDLICEDEFIEKLKNEQMLASPVQEFAARSASAQSGDNKSYLIELGKILSRTIMATYQENYKGIFNGDRDFVLQRFVEVIKSRRADSEDDSRVNLQAVTSSVMAVALELIFNSGFDSFRKTLTISVYQELED